MKHQQQLQQLQQPLNPQQLQQLQQLQQQQQQLQQPYLVDHDMIRPEHLHQQPYQHQLFIQQQQHQQHQQHQYQLQQQQQNHYYQPHFHQHHNGNMSNMHSDRPEASDQLDEYKRIIDVLHHRVRNLENINMDLEQRLEEQTKELHKVEQKGADLKKAWELKEAALTKESLERQAKYDQQVQKTERLREHLSRTERELYSILQRKYQLMRGGPQGSHPPHENGKDNDPQNLQSLKQILTAGDANQMTSTPLAAQVPTEEIADIYKKIPPDMRPTRLLMDMTEFLGL